MKLPRKMSGMTLRSACGKGSCSSMSTPLALHTRSKKRYCSKTTLSCCDHSHQTHMESTVSDSSSRTDSLQRYSVTTRQQSLGVRKKTRNRNTTPSSSPDSIDISDTNDYVGLPSPYVTSDVSSGIDLSSEHNRSVGLLCNGHGRTVGDEEQEECLKTDYTYALQSLAYVSRVTPTRECPAPNMSRHNLHQTMSPVQMLASGGLVMGETTHTEGRSLSRKFFSCMTGWYSSQNIESHCKDKNGSISCRTSGMVRYNYGLDSDSDDAGYRLRIREQEFRSSFRKQWFHWTRFSKVMSMTSYLVNYYEAFWSSVYGVMSTVLLFNMWLLSMKELFSTKHLRLLLPLLLILLCGGWWLFGGSSAEQYEFPVSLVGGAKTMSDYSLQSINLAVNVWSWAVIQSQVLWTSQDKRASLASNLSMSNIVDAVRLIVKEEAAFMKQNEKVGDDVEYWKQLLLHMQVQFELLENKYDNLVANQRNCCDNHSEYTNIVKKQVMLALDEVLRKVEGSGDEQRNCEKRIDDLKSWIVSYFVTKQEVFKSTASMQEKLKEALILEMRGEQRVVDRQGTVTSVSSVVTEEWVKNFVGGAIRKYGADQTEMADFALESGGGAVVNTRCSVTHETQSALLSVFGIPLFYMNNSPRVVIQPGVLPGECWPFKGSQGYLVIKLSARVRPTGFSLEHIPRSISTSGNIDSAPREFSVLGLQFEYDKNSVLLGTYEYDQFGDALQFFIVKDSDAGAFSFVELQINSNYGHPDYTCLYRFRVHGVQQDT